MHLPRFDYYAPRDLSDACNFLAQNKGKVMVSAGGTDILVKLKEGNASPPQFLLGLRSISGLDKIEYHESEGLRIGALCTHSSIVHSLVIREKYGILFQAASQVGSPEVRNMGTIGGNICNASPSADTVPALMVLEAKLKFMSVEGEKLLEIDKFFTGPGETVLRSGEILSEVLLPPPLSHSSGVYLTLPARTSIDLACVGLGVLVVSDEKKEICQDIKIALGSVAPTPIRARKAEEVIRGKKVESSVIRELSLVAQEEAKPITDVRGTAEYRKEMVKRLTEKAVSKAWENLQ